MNTFFVCGVPICLDAVKLGTVESSAPDAWLCNEHITLRLLADVQGVRVHTDGKAFPNRAASKAEGRWVALEDVVETSHEFANSRALPGPFTHVAWVTIPSGTTINVGLCSPLFNRDGRGVQAEYLSGPPLRFESNPGNHWHGVAGHA